MLVLPKILPLSQIQKRLDAIFPPSFPDRSILVGQMSARAIFVGRYGGFIEGSGRWFRPSTIIRFTQEQCFEDTYESRIAWFSTCHAPSHKAVGTQWYADNTREPVRDDYIRNRAIPIGIIVKREGIATTSPAPIYALSKSFSALFDPDLDGEPLTQAIDAWRAKNLDPLVLKRMALSASGVFERDGDMEVRLPNTGQVFRLPIGEASVITKAVCEVLAWRVAVRPLVVHLSMSDVKKRPELAKNAEMVGLIIDPKADLPDIIIADVPSEGGIRLTFVEVVHSDGPITELRRSALLEIARRAGVPSTHVTLITAFDDRNVGIFKKRVSELANGSSVWFRTEPHILMRIESLPDQRKIGGASVDQDALLA
jgi:hypothetical protein